MKYIIPILTLLVQLTVAGTALALPVAVDFSVLGPPANDPPLTIDITAANNPAGFTLNGVRFGYDDFGSGVDFASVDTAGIFGSTGGALILDFSTPATRLDLNFSLLDAASTSGGSQIPDSLTAAFFSNGAFMDAISVAADFFAYDPANDPALGFANGLLGFDGFFDHAEMYFSIDAPFFMVENIAYEPVPEPATVVLLAAGLLGIGGWRFIRRNA